MSCLQFPVLPTLLQILNTRWLELVSRVTPLFRGNNTAASKPASKAPTKPASKAAPKPASKAAPASKATAPAPASRARPSSSRARPSTSAAPAPAQDEDIEMKDESSTKANGEKPASKGKVPTKKGRVGALVDAEKKNRRRSSLGGGITLAIPQIPSMIWSLLKKDPG
jgi:hypothetical protein